MFGRRLRDALLGTLLTSVGTSFGGVARADVAGSFPRAAAPRSFRRGTVGPGCKPGASVAFNVYAFAIAAPGTTSITATGTSSSPLALDLYPGTFDPAAPCQGLLAQSAPSLGGTTLTASLAMGTFALVVSGTSPTDAASFSLRVVDANGRAVTTSCGAPSLLPSAFAFPAAGGNDKVTLVTTVGCDAWNVDATPAWVTFPQATGTGTSIPFSAAANTGPKRSASVTISGKTFGVTQAGGCTLPASKVQGIAANGGSGSYAAFDPACGFDLTSTATWGHVTASGGGIAYTVDPNPGPGRVGVVLVVSKDPSAHTHLIFVQGGSTATVAVPKIDAQPAGVSIDEGEPFDLAVGASGADALAFSWFQDGKAVGNEADYAVASATPANAGTYRVEVSDSAGKTASSDVKVIVRSRTGGDGGTEGGLPARLDAGELADSGEARPANSALFSGSAPAAAATDDAPPTDTTAACLCGFSPGAGIGGPRVLASGVGLALLAVARARRRARRSSLTSRP